MPFLCAGALLEAPPFILSFQLKGSHLSPKTVVRGHVEPVE